MAGWDQDIAGQRIYNDADLTDPLLDDTDNGFLQSDSELEGWTASGLAKTAAAGAWNQSAATWAGIASETDPSTAGWSQDAAWAAVGQSAEDVIADATFAQAAGSWLAASSELSVGSGTWQQTAIWEAEGDFTPVDVSSEATFDQAATWEASGDSASLEDVTATAEWTQAATWQGIGSTPSAPTTGGGFASRRPLPFRPAPEIQLVTTRASFAQPPAQWGADIDVERMPADIEDLVLAGVL